MPDAETNGVATVSRPVETQLTDGPGIFGYYSADKRWGTASTIAALYEVGRIWQLRHPTPRVGVGDISLRGGGDIEGHASHETGRDVDLRPMKNDGTEGPVTWRQRELLARTHAGTHRHHLRERCREGEGHRVQRSRRPGMRQLGQPRQPSACALLLRGRGARLSAAAVWDEQLAAGPRMSAPPEQLETAARRRGPADTRWRLRAEHVARPYKTSRPRWACRGRQGRRRHVETHAGLRCTGRLYVMRDPLARQLGRPRLS